MLHDEMSDNEMSAIADMDTAANPSKSLWFVLNERRFQELRTEIANSNASPDCSGALQSQIDALTDQLERIAADVARVKADTLLALRTKAMILEEYLEEDTQDVFHDLVFSICQDLRELGDRRPAPVKAAAARNA